MYNVRSYYKWISAVLGEVLFLVCSPAFLVFSESMPQKDLTRERTRRKQLLLLGSAEDRSR